MLLRLFVMTVFLLGQVPGVMAMPGSVSASGEHATSADTQMSGDDLPAGHCATASTGDTGQLPADTPDCSQDCQLCGACGVAVSVITGICALPAAHHNVVSLVLLPPSLDVDLLYRPPI
jgi:hypothetical protein